MPVIMFTPAAGILTFSVSINLSPYFSGLGKPIHNTISAAIGLVFTLVLSLILIPQMKLPGAALAAAISYIASTFYQFIVFVKMTKLKPADFLLRKNDVLGFVKEVKKLTIDNW